MTSWTFDARPHAMRGGLPVEPLVQPPSCAPSAWIDSPTLALFVVVLVIWRQRVLDAVATVGPFAWTLSVWRNAAAGSVAADDDID